MLKDLQISSNGNFITHQVGLIWQPSWVSLQVASDLIIVLSLFAIPLSLVYFLWRRPDFPFQGILWLFCTFLIAGGTTYLMSVWTLWLSFDAPLGLFKMITAGVACYTVGGLVQLIPEALALPTASQLEAANQALAAKIQEHRQTESELRESTQRLSLLVQQTPLAVIEWTTNFEVMEWNPAAEKIFGYSKQEALGRQAVELIVSETAREQVNQVWQQLLEQQGGTRSANANLTKERQEIYCEWYNTPLIDPRGQVIGVASLVQNITEQKYAVEALQEAKNQLEIRVEARTQELKQALAELKAVIIQLQSEIDQRQEVEAYLREREEQYRSVVDNVKEVIFQTDVNGLWTFLNPAWTEITGFAIADSLGTRFLDYVHPDDQTRNLTNFRPLFAGKKESYHDQVRYLTKDGTFRWIEVLAQLTLDDTGKIIGTCGTLNDITERHLNEQARCTSEARLRKQHLALSELAQCQSIYNGDLSIALQEITETVVRTLDLERCSVWLYSDNRSLIECVDLYERTPNRHSASYQLTSVQYPDYFNALEIQGVIAASDAHTDPRTREFSASYLTPLGITSMLDAPICLGGMTVGVLCTEHIGSKRQWSWEEQNFVSTTAYLASLAMEASNRAATERALRESEERFRSLVANIPGVVYRRAADPNWTMEFISDGITEISGYPAADLLHNQVRSFVSLIEPQDLATVEQSVSECLAQKQPYVLEYRLIGADDRVRWVYEKGQGVFGSDGSLLWFDGVIFDITEHKQIQEKLRSSEEQFRQLTENINEVFFLTTPDLSQILYISPAYQEVWGRTKESLYEQPSSWLESVHPKDRDRVSVGITRHLQQERDFAEEFRIVRPDESVRWVWVRGFFVRNQAGVATRIAGIAEDITDYKRAQTEILNALLKEKELSDLKSRFVSITSHEFRTPLTTIMSTTELLQYYEWTREEQLEQLDLIQEAIQQMLELLDDALFIGTAHAGQLRFNPESLALNGFCRKLVAEIQRGLDLKGTSMSPNHTLLFVSPDQNFLACMDKKLLRQLFSNLLLNAIKYSPSGGTVLFKLAYQGDKAVFQIQDQGIGIPQEDQALVFEFFHRAKNVGAIDGTGLGLAIVKKCVDLHGGQVTVDSEVGVGTQFTVMLPLNNAHLSTCQCTEVLAPEKLDL